MKLRNKKKLQKVPNNEKLVKRLKSKDLLFSECLEIIESFDDNFFDSSSLELELLISNGFPLEFIDDKVLLKTARNHISTQTFCIVDIETNGSDITKGQIIELGAVKYKDGKIIDKYDSLVYAKTIPPYIQEVTNITPSMLEDAPVINKVLEEFKIFLEDDVFVAHDIKFDYKFISDSFEKYDLGKLENRKLCTIDLSKRTIEAKRYGLDFLKELLNIDIKNQHRAYSDALSTSYLLAENFKKLPSFIQTAEDLIEFSKSDNLINATIPRNIKKAKNENKIKEKNV